MKIDLMTVRKRIEAQGFLGLSDGEVCELNTWFRFAPTICLVWTAVGVVYASPVILATLVPFALAGALTKGHPFDIVYNRVLRHVLGRPELPVYGKPRRFACFMASLVISTTAVLFATGYTIAAYVVGSTMIIMASVNVLTGFCVPSMLYGMLFGPVTRNVERRRGV